MSERRSRGAAPVFQTASADGSRVFFTDAQPLTDGSGARPSTKSPTCTSAKSSKQRRARMQAHRPHAGPTTGKTRTCRAPCSAPAKTAPRSTSSPTAVHQPAARTGQQPPGELPRNVAGEVGAPRTCNLYVARFDAAGGDLAAAEFIAALSTRRRTGLEGNPRSSNLEVHDAPGSHPTAATSRSCPTAA